MGWDIHRIKKRGGNVLRKKLRDQRIQSIIEEKAFPFSILRNDPSLKEKSLDTDTK